MDLFAYTYRLKGILNEAKNILIFIKSASDVDYLAAGLALYLSLSQKGKQVSVVCPDKITVEQSNLFAVDKITDQLGKGGKNLVLSFPYVEGSIEKVSYNIENNRFNLVIEPKSSEYLVKREDIEFYRSGEGSEKFDLIISLGVVDPKEFERFKGNLKIFKESQLVAIDNNNPKSRFGSLQIMSSQNGSVSEMIVLLLSRLNMPIDKDIASNLTKGIREKTNNFTNKTCADTFEAVSILMRKSTEKPQTDNSSFDYPQRDENQMSPSPINRQAPPDWLKPKIYHSGDNSSFNDDDRCTIL